MEVSRWPDLGAVATPELYQRNAFRLSGLPVDASARQVRRRADEVEAAVRLDAELTVGDAWLPPAEVAVDDVRAALHRLRDPVRRIVDELFWLWPGLGGDTLADAALIWADAVEADPPVPVTRAIARHNRAVVGHPQRAGGHDARPAPHRGALAGRRSELAARPRRRLVLVHEAEAIMTEARGLIEANGSPHDQESLPAYERTIAEAIESRDADLLRQRIDELRQHVARVLDRGPLLQLLIFQELEALRGDMRNAALADRLLAEGRRAVDTGQNDRLRTINPQLQDQLAEELPTGEVFSIVSLFR